MPPAQPTEAPLPHSTAARSRGIRPIPASNTPAAAAPRCRPHAGARRALLLLQLSCVAGGHHTGLVHRLHPRRTHTEQAGIDHLQQIEILLLSPAEVRLKYCHPVVMQFTAGEHVAPPRRTVAN